MKEHTAHGVEIHILLGTIIQPLPAHKGFWLYFSFFETLVVVSRDIFLLCAGHVFLRGMRAAEVREVSFLGHVHME